MIVFNFFKLNMPAFLLYIYYWGMKYKAPLTEYPLSTHPLSPN